MRASLQLTILYLSSEERRFARGVRAHHQKKSQARRWGGSVIFPAISHAGRPLDALPEKAGGREQRAWESPANNIPESLIA